MAMSQEELKNAFREVASSEFSNIPFDENNIEFTFSKRFNKKMEKLIKAQKKTYWHFVNTTSKRAAIILVAILTMLTTVVSVKAIREPVLKFIKQVYETFTHYSFDGDTTNKITKEYSIKTPSHFEQTNKIQNNAIIATEYMNSSGDIIEFKQMTTEYSTGYFIDNEQGSITTEIINGIEVEFKTWYDTQSAIWTTDGYVLAIDCYGNINRDTIKQMINSIE